VAEPLGVEHEEFGAVELALTIMEGRLFEMNTEPVPVQPLTSVAVMVYVPDAKLLLVVPLPPELH